VPATAPPIEKLPDRLRFSLGQLLLAVTAFAVYLGLLRWVGPLALYFAVAIWVALLFMQLDSEIRATLWILAQSVGGVVVPLTLLFLSRSNFVLDQIPKWVVFIYVCWALGLVMWVIVVLFRMPRFSALACGYLTTFGGMFTWIGAAAVLTGNKVADPATGGQWDMFLAFATITALIVSGFVVGITFFIAAVQAWQRSYRNLLAWGLIPIGMVLALALPVVVLRLLLI
jgi:hypothetical protein